MIQKLLIANRGEIAVRIIRACREMGIATVAVYSEADQDSLHTQLADEAVCIGPAPSKDSYLNMERILSAALVTGADAVHPGFGFLSENARFAEVCEKCNLTFVGPSSEVIRALGNKQVARNTMVSAGIPVIPGTDHPILDEKEGAKEAERIGYPVIIKAALGGGGKGMRTAWTREEFSQAFLTAKKEAESAFGDGTMYIEHFVEHPRHIEFQILADSQGHVIHLGERDCSIQRNHQKMIEESPSAAISPRLRKVMGKAAVGAAKAAGYVNAGTIEFLLEGNGKFYFMEMNTRIQVEHPVTEFVTGLDLVKEQLRIASGLPLSVTQKEVRSSAGSTLKIPRKAFVLLREKFLRFIFQGETESGWIRESTAVIRCRPTTIPWWQSLSSTEKTGPRLLRKCGAPWGRRFLTASTRTSTTSMRF